MQIDIQNAPPTAQQIEAMRAAIRRNEPIEDSAAFKAFMFCPLPGLDVIAGAATYAVEQAFKSDPEKPLQPVRGSHARSWPSGSAAEAYANQVKSQPRELVECEVEALERAVSIESATQWVVDSAVRALQSTAADFFASKK